MPLQGIEHTVASWPRITVHSHRFGGRQFRFANAEVGHVHYGGIVDIPFPRSVRDALLTEGLAEEHRWVPNSGWVTFRVRSDSDLQHAVWLMRLSYFRYALKAASDPRELFELASRELQLTARFKSLLEQFLPCKKQDLVS
jgi:Luciferase